MHFWTNFAYLIKTRFATLSMLRKHANGS